MVNFMDISKLSLEELAGVVDIYPWYSGARMELCRRMASLGALSDSQISRTAMYIASRELLFELVHSGKRPDCSDAEARKLIGSYLKGTSKNSSRKRPYVPGGDYFSPEQYEQVREPDDAALSKFKERTVDPAYYSPREESNEELYTETLARIYLEQDYREKAIEIYYNLSLRYPGKSVYFASLIEKIKQKEQ